MINELNDVWNGSQVVYAKPARKLIMTVSFQVGMWPFLMIEIREM